MGARTRYSALKHLTETADVALSAQKLPQVACFAFDVISSSIMVDGRFEAEELDALQRLVFPKLDHRRVCLDIGANIGNHSLFFADHFDRVLAFEPHPRTFRLLELNAELVDNVETHNIGLSDSAGTVSAAPIAGNIGMASIGRNADESAHSVEFDVLRLDALQLGEKHQSIDFLKIDVEGHELPALMGASVTLQKHKPVVAMEVLKDDIHNGTSEAIEFLTSLGYAHRYVLQSNRPFSRAPKAISKLMVTLAGLLFDKRPEKKFSLEAFTALEARNYPVVILSAKPLL